MTEIKHGKKKKKSKLHKKINKYSSPSILWTELI